MSKGEGVQFASWQITSGYAFKLNDSFREFRFRIDVSKFCVGEPPLFVQNIEQPELTELVGFPDDLQIFFGLIDNSAAKHGKRVFCSDPTPVSRFNFKRDCGFEVLLAKCAC